MTSAALVAASQSLQLRKLMHVPSSIVDLFADALGALFRTWCIGKSLWSWCGWGAGRWGPCRRWSGFYSPSSQLSASVALSAKARRWQKWFHEGFCGTLTTQSGYWAQSTKHASRIGDPFIPPWPLLLPKTWQLWGHWRQNTDMDRESHDGQQGQ